MRLLYKNIGIPLVEISYFIIVDGMVVRSCGTTGMENDCTEVADVTTCLCDTDLCNSAQQYGQNLFFAVISAFVIMKIF